MSKNDFAEKMELLQKIIQLQQDTIHKQQKIMEMQEQTIDELLEKNAKLHMQENE